MATLRELAEAAAAEGELPDDPEQAAEVIAGRIRDERPEASVRGAQNAARRALGLEPVEAAARQYREVTALEDRRRAGRRRAVARVGRRAGRAASRLRPRLPTSRAASIGGLVSMALGLVALLWFLRSAEVVSKLTAGLGGALEWLRAPVPVGVSPGGVRT